MAEDCFASDPNIIRARHSACHSTPEKRRRVQDINTENVHSLLVFFIRYSYKLLILSSLWTLDSGWPFPRSPATVFRPPCCLRRRRLHPIELMNNVKNILPSVVAACPDKRRWKDANSQRIDRGDYNGVVDRIPRVNSKVISSLAPLALGCHA
jgi:hypothetical protein